MEKIMPAYESKISFQKSTSRVNFYYILFIKIETVWRYVMLENLLLEYMN